MYYRSFSEVTPWKLTGSIEPLEPLLPGAESQQCSARFPPRHGLFTETQNGFQHWLSLFQLDWHDNRFTKACIKGFVALAGRRKRVVLWYRVCNNSKSLFQPLHKVVHLCFSWCTVSIKCQFFTKFRPAKPAYGLAWILKWDCFV